MCRKFLLLYKKNSAFKNFLFSGYWGWVWKPKQRLWCTWICKHRSNLDSQSNDKWLCNSVCYFTFECPHIHVIGRSVNEMIKKKQNIQTHLWQFVLSNENFANRKKKVGRVFKFAVVYLSCACNACV